VADLEHPVDEQLLREAKVLVELGWLHEAELEVATVLDRSPDSLSALSLLAKIKHIRGELSAAIACWAHIHARSPHNETARMQLGALLHLAQDPERGAGEFLVLGQYQLQRKPAGQLALEKAFALFHERRPTEARAQCVEVANRYRSSDRGLYKLAMLANAWIAELSGDLELASELLERLGKERGFETDLDRLLALVRLYERIGNPERLDAAVKICRHLLREFDRRHIEKISLYSQLAGLHRRLGETDAAAECEQQFLAGVRRRMHRPSFAEVVEVAARRYLPLERLQALRLTPEEPPAHASRRERALAYALLGHRDRARSLLADGGELLDRKYLAFLAVLEGDLERATQLFLDTLAQDGSDLHVISWLLERSARAPVPAIAAHFASDEVRARTISLLEAAISSEPLQSAYWFHLAELQRLGGQPDEATRARERGSALAEAARARSLPIGRVLAAGVYHFIGKGKGLIHEVWAHREPTAPGRGGVLPPEHILGNLTPEMKVGIRNTFLAVREYARTKFPHRTGDLLDYNYTYKVPKEDEPSGGLSAGLPSALAFLSVFLQQPVPQDIASSGMLVTEAHDVISVAPVGESDYKVKAAYHRNLRALILPAGNRPELERSTLAPAAISGEIVQYASDFDQAVKLVFGPDVFSRV
jgi:Lon protease (S16) C-terminal proteolytic domain